MSLEDALKANTEAVLALTKALNAAALTTVSGNGNAVAEAVAAIDKAAGKNKAAAKETAAAETKAAEPEKAAERPADVPQEITYDTLKRPFLDLVKIHGAPKVLAMLNPVGVQNSLKEIENVPGQWSGALAILQRELAAAA